MTATFVHMVSHDKDFRRLLQFKIARSDMGRDERALSVSGLATW